MMQSTVRRVRGWLAGRRTYWDRHCKNCGHEFRPNEPFIVDGPYRFCVATGETDSSISNPRPSCLDIWDEYGAIR